jgi:hypothetical protein
MRKAMYLSISLDVSACGPGGEGISSFRARAEEIETLAPDFVFLVSEDKSGVFHPPRVEALVNIAWVSGVLRSPIIIAGLPGLHSLPFHVARALSASDFLSDGRVGYAALLAGAEKLEASHAVLPDGAIGEAPARADDFVAATRALWDSWDQDALVLDKVGGAYLDSTKIRRVDYRGPYFKTMGSLNAARPPQGHPLLARDMDTYPDSLQHAEVLVGKPDVLPEVTPANAVRLVKASTLFDAEVALESHACEGVHLLGENAVSMLAELRKSRASKSVSGKTGRDRLGLDRPKNSYSNGGR